MSEVSIYAAVTAVFCVNGTSLWYQAMQSNIQILAFVLLMLPHCAGIYYIVSAGCIVLSC